MSPRPAVVARAAPAAPPAVERLEPRQLLAGDAAGCAGDLNASSASSSAAPAVAVPLKPAIVAETATVAERFVGTFSGTGSNPKKRFDLNLFDMQVVVTSVGGDGFVGSVTVDTSNYGGNRREVAASFTGKLHPKGGFAFRLREPGVRVSFKGRLTPQTDRLVGKVRMRIGPGTGIARGDVGGTYWLERVAAPA